MRGPKDTYVGAVVAGLDLANQIPERNTVMVAVHPKTLEYL